jgi:hypothetical protein
MSPNLIFVLQAFFAVHVEKYGVMVTFDCQRSTYESRPENMTPSASFRHDTKRSHVGHCSKYTSLQKLTHPSVLEMQQSGPYTFNPSILYIILFGIVSQRRHRNTDGPFQMPSLYIVSFRFPHRVSEPLLSPRHAWVPTRFQDREFLYHVSTSFPLMVQWRRHFRSEAHVISHEMFRDTQSLYHFSFFTTHAPVAVRVVTHVVIVDDM